QTGALGMLHHALEPGALSARSDRLPVTAAHLCNRAHVVAPHDAAPWIGRVRVLRKNPEPRPGMPGARILPLKGVGKRNAAAALGLVLQPQCPCTRQLLAQAGCQALG